MKPCRWMRTYVHTDLYECLKSVAAVDDKDDEARYYRKQVLAKFTNSGAALEDKQARATFSLRHKVRHARFPGLRQ